MNNTLGLEALCSILLALKKTKTKNYTRFKKKINQSGVVVAHTCNPSYSGGRDQEDLGLKPAWANSF
jgi:hypothetical protein